MTKDLYKRQMRGCGGGLSFQAKDVTPEKYRKFAQSCRVFQNASSWGGHESLIFAVGVYAPLKDATSFSLDSLESGVIRIYTGLENTNDLFSDLEQALKAFD